MSDGDDQLEILPQVVYNVSGAAKCAGSRSSAVAFRGRVRNRTTADAVMILWDDSVLVPKVAGRFCAQCRACYNLSLRVRMSEPRGTAFARACPKAMLLLAPILIVACTWTAPGPT